MKPKWIIDKQITKDTRYEHLEDIIKECGFEVSVMNYVPFYNKTDYIKPYDVNDCVIMYGTINLLRKIPDYFGTFLSDDRLRYHNYSSNCGLPSSSFLNSDFVMTTYHDFRNNFWKYAKLFNTDELFIRPDSGFKTFTGMPIDGMNYIQELNALDQLSGAMNNTMIVVAAQKPILAEHRFIVVDGIVIDGSSYKLNNISVENRLSNHEMQLVQNIVNGISSSPEPIYTIDMAIVENDYKIIELNSFSSAGWYACDPYNVVHCVSNFVEKLWNEQNE